VFNPGTNQPYPNSMPPMAAVLSANEIDAVIMYIKEQK
jgi:hypothetical protein